MIKNPESLKSITEITEKPGNWFLQQLQNEKIVLCLLFGLIVLVWLPRFRGPIDLRWDGGVYYILGTSLAEGKGYKLLNEPGEIDAVQYPPLLPLIIAGYQLILGTDDPTTVGHWLRFSAFLLFSVYIYVVFIFFKKYFSLQTAFLATVLCIFSRYVYFLSDLCFPEILFSLATVLFILCIRRNENRSDSILSYFFAVISYGLRTIGVTAFAVWILQSLLQRNFKQAFFRLVLVILPIAGWQIYIASVESSFEYNHPAYAYQRAPYMFYNVSYARNLTLRDPFNPEENETPIPKTEIVRRFVVNAVRLPANLGETVAILRNYPGEWLENLFGKTKFKPIISWSVFFFLYAVGLCIIGGIGIQIWRSQWSVPLYIIPFLAFVCLTPFPKQFARYLMPVVPFLVLFLIIFLSAVRNSCAKIFTETWADFGRYFGCAILAAALLLELSGFISAYTKDHQLISYPDKNNELVEYPLFFDTEWQRNFDLCITYISQNAKSDDVIAAGTPHWVYLRTGLKTVMPPFEKNPGVAQQLLDSVPVKYLIIGKDVVNSEQFALPVVQNYPENWTVVFNTPDSSFAVYRRVDR